MAVSGCLANSFANKKTVSINALCKAICGTAPKSQAKKDSRYFGVFHGMKEKTIKEQIREFASTGCYSMNGNSLVGLNRSFLANFQHPVAQEFFGGKSFGKYRAIDWLEWMRAKKEVSKETLNLMTADPYFLGLFRNEITAFVADLPQDQVDFLENKRQNIKGIHGNLLHAILTNAEKNR